jgi:hypothetical protein
MRTVVCTHVHQCLRVYISVYACSSTAGMVVHVTNLTPGSMVEDTR